MDMQLQPVYADEGGGASGIRIDQGLQQNLGIRYATVRRQQTAAGFDAVGTTQFDESRADVVQSRVTGYIDHLHARAPMQRIAKGAPVASLFVPDWLAPQEEYLALKRGGMDGSLLDASRARMRALSIPDGMIARLDRTGRVQTHVVLTAPETGVVSELNVRDGAMVAPGQTLAKIAGLSTLWLIVEVPEALALTVQPGMAVDATFAGDPAAFHRTHPRSAARHQREQPHAAGARGDRQRGAEAHARHADARAGRRAAERVAPARAVRSGDRDRQALDRHREASRRPAPARDGDGGQRRRQRHRSARRAERRRHGRRIGAVPDRFRGEPESVLPRLESGTGASGQRRCPRRRRQQRHRSTKPPARSNRSRPTTSRSRISPFRRSAGAR